MLVRKRPKNKNWIFQSLNHQRKQKFFHTALTLHQLEILQKTNQFKQVHNQNCQIKLVRSQLIRLTTKKRKETKMAAAMIHSKTILQLDPRKLWMLIHTKVHNHLFRWSLRDLMFIMRVRFKMIILELKRFQDRFRWLTVPARRLYRRRVWYQASERTFSVFKKVD